MGVCFEPDGKNSGAGGEGNPDDDKNKGGQGEGQGQGQGQGNEPKTFSEDYVKGLRQESAKYRTKLKELEEKLGELDRIDLEEYERLKKEKEEAERKRLEAAGEFDKIKEQLQNSHQKELIKRDTEIAQLESGIAQLEAALDRSTLDNAIALELAKVKSYNPKLIAMQLASETKIERSEDGHRIIRLVNEDGSTHVNGKGEAMSLRERLAEMKQDEAFAILFEGAIVGAGSRTSGNGGKLKNPWLRDSFNLTEQGRLVRESPELARKYAAEAGVTLYGM
jgi:hypothetical protein